MGIYGARPGCNPGGPRRRNGIWVAGAGRPGRPSDRRQPVAGCGNRSVPQEVGMRLRIALAIAAVSISCSRPAPTPAPANQSAHDAHGTPAPAAAAPRTALLGNLGSYHREIKTTNADAQKHFDEGLNLLYGFNHEESFKSFELAAKHDDKAPMPHWGMALALGTNINDLAPADRLKQTYAHLAEAQKRKAAGSAVEQGLIDALTKRYVADASGDQAVREKEYSAAMAALSKKFPEDVDVATLYAESMMNLKPWQLYTKDGKPVPGTNEIVAALEGAMK